MSRTDHPRPRRVRAIGHRPEVRPVRFYGVEQQLLQSRCSCGQVGPIQSRWVEANNDGRAHVDEQAKAFTS